MSYRAPVKDLLFAMRELAGLEALARLPGFEDASADTAQAILEECARLNENVVAPLNRTGDLDPARFADGRVTATPGFDEAFRQFGAGGWQGLQHPAEHGGQGLPKLIGTACMEMLNSANLSFALCPLLTDGAVEALLTAGSPAQQALYLPPMLSGRWTGSMNLTEPQAGSDLARVRTRAEPQADGSYRIFGDKIFITWGEHELAENIVHLVLARVAGAPEGVKGLSLFIVPKFLVQSDGGLGARNDVRCLGIEHKLGIRASPTATLKYGGGSVDDGVPGAWAERVGDQNRGLEYMFVMMNAARFAVGVQGVALAERAYQAAVAYARERVQSRPADPAAPADAPILHHPDVRRMLMTMRAQIEACRALALVGASAADLSRAHPDAAVREENRVFHEFVVPLLKGYATEMSLDAASLCIQVHGGMGFVEETGVAQYLRDAKILAIYEGTTAIQANDFVGRKTLRDGGVAARAIAARIEATEAELHASGGADALALAARLGAARQALLACIGFVVERGKVEPAVVHAGAVPYLMLAAQTLGGWLMGRALLAAEASLARGEDAEFMRAKIATARFYGDQVLSHADGLRQAVVEGHAGVLGMPLEAF